jgi:hypothetical protein
MNLACLNTSPHMYRGPRRAPMTGVPNYRRVCGCWGGILRLMGWKAVL